MKNTFFTLLIFCSTTSFGQVVLEPLQSIPAYLNDKQFLLPWTGGLNAAQYGKADLDGDAVEEIIVYDRSVDLFQVFKVVNSNLQPANELAVLLPDVPAGWILFVDYNGDGQKDIFSNGSRGAIVYKNVGVAGQLVSWEKVADPIFTQGFSSKINLIVNAADVPAITDIDGDGDIDILVYNFAVGGYIRFNKNLSQELYGHSDSLEYEIRSRTWGEFAECDCNLFAFGEETCESIAGGRVTHAGGKALLAFDSDGDGDKDLLVGHEQCEELYFYENMGDRDSAYMIDYSNAFPENQKPANFEIFPAAYFEDLDFDGVKDLAVTPNFGENQGYKIDYARSNWLYKNIGTDQNPDFTFITDNWLQEENLDFGENSVPLLVDLDGDGDLDLLVAANGFNIGDSFSGYVIELENKSSDNGPEFIIVNEDYLSLSAMGLFNPKLNTADMNNDGVPDLIYTAINDQSFKAESWVLPGTGDSFDTGSKIKINLPDEFDMNDNPAFSDIDGDGIMDLLVGKRNGALHYYRSNGANFSLMSDAFLGIERDFSLERLNLSVTVADLDGNGDVDLLTTDATGVGKIYFGFKNMMDSEAEFIEISYENSISETEETFVFGSLSCLAAGDLFGLGSESLVVGGAQGGLRVLKNNEVAGPGSGRELKVNIFPNPLWQTSELTIRSNDDVQAEIVSVLGQRVLEPIEIKKFTTTRLDLASLSSGTYILRSSNKSGLNASQLLMIQR